MPDANGGGDRVPSLHAGGLHRVFTATWQKADRDADQATKCDQRLEGRLGQDLQARLEAIRQEIQAPPSKAEALAYLQRKPRGDSGSCRAGIPSIDVAKGAVAEGISFLSVRGTRCLYMD